MPRSKYADAFNEFPRDLLRPIEGICLLGSPLWGNPSFFQQAVNSFISKTLSLQSNILALEDPQVELHLLRSCLGICKLNHILRTVPNDTVCDQLSTFDKGLRSSLSDILQCSISDISWKQAMLPFCLSGLGFRQVSSSAAAAFIASTSTAKCLADFILPPTEPSPHSFPGESSSFNHFLTQIRATTLPDNLSPSSQSSLQAALDETLMEDLTHQLDLYGRTWLQTLASSNDASSWLKAPPPIPNLGLSMPPSEFSMAACIWLGISTFPSNPVPLYPCNTPIDPNGDRLLGCGHGPLRIRRHDALWDVIYQTLLLDSSAVRRGQRIPGLSQE